MSIEEIEKNIEYLNKILILLKEEPQSVVDLIFKKYVEFESLPKVKKFIQEQGIKTSRGTIYQPTELSEIIQTNPDGVNQDLVKLAHKIFKSNTRIVNRLYN